MGAIYVQTGNAVDFTPAVNISAGDVVVQNDLIGVAKLDIPAGGLGVLAMSGVYDFPKAAGQVIGAGSKLYWDEAEKIAKPDDEAGTNKYIGKSVKGSTDKDVVVRIRLA
jgi:predicted RecA/RadA family phage recombinase